MLQCELFSSSGIAMTSCGRDMNEVSNSRHSPSQGAEERRYIKHKNRVNRVVKLGTNSCNGCCRNS